MRLRDEIVSAGMPAAVARTFAEALRQVAAADGHLHSSELVAIEAMLSAIAPYDVEGAPLDALWPFRNLLVRAAIHVAMVDGGYGVQEARTVSELAHRLGLSADELERVEAGVFVQLRRRAEGKPAAG